MQHDNKFVLNDTVIFDIILFIFFLVLAVLSVDYNPRARSIPLGLGILGSAMMFFQLLADAIPALRSHLHFVVQSGILGAGNETNQKNEEKPERVTLYWWKVTRVVLWLAGFVVLLTQVNYLIAVGLFIILITKLEAKESWLKSIVLALCLDASFYILFDLILQAHL